MEFKFHAIISIIFQLFLTEYVYCKGCVHLDSLSFDKVISKFKAALVKFDTSYPYGAKQEEYEKVCLASSNVEDLLIVEIPIKDYGEKDNEELAKKYDVKKESYPAIKLFLQGNAKPISFEAKTDEDYTADEIKKFIRSKSGVYIGLPGCLKDFDNLAEEFSNEKSADAKKKLLRKAEDLWDQAKGNTEKKSAEVYVKVMRKVLEKGEDFLKTESTRVTNVLKGKVSKDKTEEMQQRINILQAFQTHDEL